MPGAVLFVTAVVVVVAKIRNRRRKKDLHKIPLAPGTLPIVGNLGVAKAFSQNLLHIKHAEFAEAAGEAGMLRVCVLGHTRVTLTTPATWAAVLRPGVFLPKPLAFYNVFSVLGIKGIPLINEVREAEHARVRGHLMHALNADTVAASIWQLSDTVQRSIAAVTRCHAEGPQGDAQSRRARSIDSGDAESGVCWGDVNSQGVLVNMFSLAAANILSVVFRVFLEVDMTPPMAVFSDCLAHASSIAAHPALLPLMRRGLYPGRRRYRRNFDTLYAFHEELLARVYAKPLPEGSRTMWAALRRAYPDAMTDRHVYEAAISNLAFVYGASYETTANAAMHTLAALALDQDSQTAIVEELQAEGLLATPDNPEPRGVAAEDFSRLTVLDAVIHESLRLMPTAPNGGLRILTKDTTIGGLVLPKGTDVMMSSWSLHYNRHVWGDDAACWRPDRWLEGRSVAAARKDAAGLPRFQPFLIGPSNCVGQHLALAELKMIVVSVVSRLHVALDEQHMGHLRSVEDYVRETVSRITLQRATPCWLRLKPRVEPRSAA